ASAPRHTPHLSLHDALPILDRKLKGRRGRDGWCAVSFVRLCLPQLAQQLYPASDGLARGWPESLLTRIGVLLGGEAGARLSQDLDRKSTRLNSSHVKMSYAV